MYQAYRELETCLSVKKAKQRQQVLPHHFKLQMAYGYGEDI